MECYTCRRDVELTRHVKLRIAAKMKEWESPPAPDSPAYKHYVEQWTYRTAFVCPGCYRDLDSLDGTAEIAGTLYNINGASRAGKAAVYDEKRHKAFQRRTAARLGLPEL
jgi:hypothetical protein